ncbi:DUF3549 family protein [Paraglaciecola chathamensis]|uniref:DUF3549 domain-containing protein n=1 Tax=Paraglaciecola chathamensis S18K6 TaxID=1127672 RepID=A0AAV3V146_9ALTE|nr:MULTISPECIES: DUF3549 family protein [Paraglaciecola]MBN27406.1 DUF3549 domain-containing protein [Alteromonadaceae bacterium]GAC10572.1 hypothetical protein GCHA_2625 [Paraglaciecola chathamensis S18K6]|tara:strand:- start:6236 stop:7261 length:1026 start_codon:yes stop_codon:yes gene_type:complete
MNQISSISEFLLHAQTEYHVFDMGRTIRSLDSQTFLNIENASEAAPYPRQEHAWFGIVFFSRQLSREHYIWFVKLPLDEKGLVISATRNHFLQIITDALGAQLERNKEARGRLPENPYTFVPNQQQLADFNSVSRGVLKLPPSEYYSAAVRYIAHPQAHNWQEVALQGIADVAASVRRKDGAQLITAHLFETAPQVQQALMSSLENYPLDKSVSQQLIDNAEQHFADLSLIQWTLRALSQSVASTIVKAFIQKILDSQHNTVPEIMLLIAARHWQYLQDEKVLRQYIERLALIDIELCADLYSDLVRIPSVRPAMLGIIRWQDKTYALTQVIGHLFSGQQK